MSKDMLPEELPTVDSFEDRIDVLVHELGLAIKWDRPSILFAIYRSEFVRAEAEAVLKSRLNSLGLQVVQVHARQEAHFDLLTSIDGLKDLDKTALFIDGFKWECGPEGARVFKEVNLHREYFIDNNLRAIFWLYEDEVSNFANIATECWILRHRVVEFTDAPRPVQTLLQTLDSIWDGLDQDLESGDELPIKSLIEILENGLPEGSEANTVHANILLTLGILYWRRGNSEGALRFLKAALEIADLLDNPQLLAQCNNAIALASTRLGDVDGAIDAYTHAASQVPEIAIPWYYLGQLLSQRERNEEALIVFKRAVEQDPADVKSWDGLGHTFVKLGLCQNAISAFQHALKIDPRLVSSWIGLGNACSQGGQTDQSLHAYQMVTKLDPENALAWREQGNLHLKAGSFKESVAAFEKVLTLRPTCGLALSGLAYANARLGNLAEAASLFQRSIPLFEKPKDQARLWSHLVDIYRKQNDPERAQAALHQLEILMEGLSRQEADEVRTDPDLVLAQNDVQGGLSAAVWAESATPVRLPAQEYTPVEALSPETGWSRDNPEAASQDFDLRNAIQWNEIGNNLLKAGSFNDAIAAYTRAIEMEPGLNWPYISNLAHACYHKGKLWGKKTSTQPEDPDVWGLDEEEMDVPAATQDDLPVPERRDDLAGQELEVPQPQALLDTVDESKLSDLLAGLQETPGGEWSLDPALLDELPTMCACETASEPPAVSENPPDPAPDADPAADPVSLNSLIGASLGEDPGNSVDWNELGNAYARNGEHDRAINAYKKAILMNPRFGLPYSNLGFVYFHRGEYPIAIALYKKSLEMLDTPDEKATTWNRLGDAYRRMREYGSALKAYEHAGSNDPVTTPIMARTRVALMGNSPQ
jgi:tetratricopeptide (TPR) repeat protein